MNPVDKLAKDYWKKMNCSIADARKWAEKEYLLQEEKKKK
jgi:hypothetical protein